MTITNMASGLHSATFADFNITATKYASSGMVLGLATAAAQIRAGRQGMHRISCAGKETSNHPTGRVPRLTQHI